MRRSLAVTATMLSVLSLSASAHIGFANGPAVSIPSPSPAASQSDEPTVSAKRQKQIDKREKAFTELLTGCVLVGQFTVDGKPLSPKPERYEIKSVSKIEGNQWLITARIKYGQIDADFPITLPVEWADDQTPVLILDNLEIPLLGTFGGRVMFHGDRYVATWQHGKVGGHMFGSIERAAKPKDDKAIKKR